MELASTAPPPAVRCASEVTVVPDNFPVEGFILFKGNSVWIGNTKKSVHTGMI